MSDKRKLRNVLIITRQFPPLNTIAARRFGWMCQYFEEFGWKPFIITMNSEGNLKMEISQDQIIRIGKSHQTGSKIVRSQDDIVSGKHRSVSPLSKNSIIGFLKKTIKWRLRSFDHTMLNWNKEVKRQMETILEKLPELDVIIGTYSPAATHSIASTISKKTSTPWIADFRDLGALSVRDSNKDIQWLDKWIEKQRLRSAWGVTTISKNYAEAFQYEYDIRSETIFNGYHEINKQSNSVYDKDQIYQSDRPYIYHAGRIYPHRMEAFQLCIKALSMDKKRTLVFRSLGPMSLERELLQFAESLNVSDRFVILEPTSAEIVNAEKNAAFLTLVTEDLSENEKAERGFLSGKFLQLLPGTVPVLSVCRPDNEMAEILNETGRGIVSNTVEGIVKFLDEIELNPGKYTGDKSKVEKYSTKNQAKKMCALMDEITNTDYDK